MSRAPEGGESPGKGLLLDEDVVRVERREGEDPDPFPGERLEPEILMDLVKAYFESGGFQVQFNMVDSGTLKEAQERPEKHRDLVVRVSGYSALFTLLSDTAQDEIIGRTEFEL